MLSFILAKIKAVILSLIKLFGRCLCCLRKRRNSDLGTQLTITSINKNENEPDSWDEWGSPEIVISDKKPSTTSEHIEAYRQHLAITRQKSEEPEPEEMMDLFVDMAPKIRKQKKIFVGKEEKPASSRLAIRPECTDPVLALGSELESWGEGGTEAGWSEDSSLDDLLKLQKLKR
ncbi:uncharacterized protein LOC111707698 [Eurytemora carolleeae]|uniref:uncharacterized protein LOC111707698 n=1 Tax=Eurytemora carolleeae TaxID=1294199 RepID=UPI000C77A345|nr:uncharacterized protein LOC111707698 [Eurytemora carolleeae]|eukprot:XP_023336605.1 uncharacterized protein LOC111707698 [Eurytemora affinis]